MRWDALVVAVLGSSVLTALITSYFTRRKTQADAAKTEAEAGKAEADTLEQMQRTMQALLVQAQDLMARLETTEKKYGDTLQENVGLKALVAEQQATIAAQRGQTKALTNEVQSVKRQLNDIEAAIGKLGADGNGSGPPSKDPLPQESKQQ